MRIRRREWLRRFKAAPLIKRAVKVLGSDGLPLWREYHSEYDHNDQSDHRRLLRYLATFPAMSRRHAYLKKLINKPLHEEDDDPVIQSALNRCYKLGMTFENMEVAWEQLNDNFQLKEYSPAQQQEFQSQLLEAKHAAEEAKEALEEARSPNNRLQKAIGIKQAGRYFNKLCDVYITRYTPDIEKAAYHARRIMMNASKVKPHPKKYMDVVMRNVKLEIKRRKTKQKRTRAKSSK